MGDGRAVMEEWRCSRQSIAPLDVLSQYVLMRWWALWLLSCLDDATLWTLPARLCPHAGDMTWLPALSSHLPYEPSPRYGHTATLVGRHMYIWGGMAARSPPGDAATLYVFDIGLEAPSPPRVHHRMPGLCLCVQSRARLPVWHLSISLPLLVHPPPSRPSSSPPRVARARALRA